MSIDNPALLTVGIVLLSLIVGVGLGLVSPWCRRCP